MTIPLPSGVIPVQDLTTTEVLYGPRSTTYRYELLEHDPTTGVDSLLGYLDGVSSGRLAWAAAARVKKSGSLTVNDLSNAADGLIRVGDIDLVTTRIRPVRMIEGLPEQPLSLYTITAAPERWTETGRIYELEVHDKSTVLDQDAVEESFTAGTADPVLEIVRDVIVSAGEQITVVGSDTRTLAAPMVWPAGTSKLSIVNDLLDVIQYNALWVDEVGSFRTTPYVRPADRSIRYSMLNEDGEALVRELTYGEDSIYAPDWQRDRDVYGVPNKVIAIQQGSGDDEALTGIALNEDPNSPFSYPSRGRWIARVLDNVDTPDFSAEVDPAEATEEFLNGKAEQSLIAASAVQAGVSVQCLPIPLELLDAVIFQSAPAGIDARHTVQRAEFPLTFDALMGLELLEVIDLDGG